MNSGQRVVNMMDRSGPNWRTLLRYRVTQCQQSGAAIEASEESMIWPPMNADEKLSYLRSSAFIGVHRRPKLFLAGQL
jgi:hypothetical protein